MYQAMEWGIGMEWFSNRGMMKVQRGIRVLTREECFTKRLKRGTKEQFLFPHKFCPQNFKYFRDGEKGIRLECQKRGGHDGGFSIDNEVK